MFNIFERLKELSQIDGIAIVEDEQQYSYNDLWYSIQEHNEFFQEKSLVNKVVIFIGDFNYNSISALLSLLYLKNIVLLKTEIGSDIDYHQKLINADYVYNSFDNDILEYSSPQKNDLINELIANKQAGIVFLSSGTTGKPKAILHKAESLFQKYEFSKKAFTTLAFLLFDHIAGIDTLFYTLSAGGALVCLEDRSPETVVRSLQENQIEVFPTSPSYINMLLLNDDFYQENLPNLKVITFGSERMSSYTLKNLQLKFHSVRILQKYGITEMGSPFVICKESDPAWIKIDRRNTDYKIEDDTLFLKSNSSMMGYIYEDRCESFDGWFNTQDKVEVDGEWIKILGRVTDIINVGGQKVYPAEVESVLLEIYNVKEVSVFSKENPIMGKVVGARFNLKKEESVTSLKKRVRQYCKDKLESFKIPVHIEITKENQVSERFKKVR